MQFSRYLAFIAFFLLQSSVFADYDKLRASGEDVHISPIEREVTLISDDANVLIQYKNFKVVVTFDTKSKAISMKELNTGKPMTFAYEAEAKGKGKGKTTRNGKPNY